MDCALSFKDVCASDNDYCLHLIGGQIVNISYTVGVL